MYTHAAFEEPTARVSSLQKIVQDVVLGLPASAAHGLHEHENIEYSLAYRIIDELSTVYLMKDISYAGEYKATRSADGKGLLAAQMTHELIQKIKDYEATSASVGYGSLSDPNPVSPYSRRSGRTHTQQARFSRRSQHRHITPEAKQNESSRSGQRIAAVLPTIDFRAMTSSIDDAALANPIYASIVANPALESAITIFLVLILTIGCGNFLLSSAH